MNRFHGIFSLLIIMAAIVLGVLAISFTSVLQAVIYVIITIGAVFCILYFYCLKCTCRLDGCGHVLPGKLTKFFPDREPGKYSALDLAITSIAIAVIAVFPQYWLWKYKILFIAFWILIVTGVIEILLFVCKECENANCPICQGYKRRTIRD